MNYETIKWQHNVHLIFHCEYSDFLLVILPFLNSILPDLLYFNNVVYKLCFTQKFLNIWIARN